MSTFARATGIRIVDEFFLKYWLDDIYQRSMDYPISEVGSGNMALLGIGDHKVDIGLGDIFITSEQILEQTDIVFPLEIIQESHWSIALAESHARI